VFPILQVNALLYVPVVFVLAGSAVLAGLMARFFYYNFYVYQYATGISAAAIVERILDEGEPAAADYREALCLGGREYPLEVLRTAGVDLTDSEPIERALAVYGDYLDEAASLL
jgi:oligoendopeptidase F